MRGALSTSTTTNTFSTVAYGNGVRGGTGCGSGQSGWPVDPQLLEIGSAEFFYTAGDESGVARWMAGETEAPADRWVLATWTLIRRDNRWLLTAYHNCPAQ